MHRTIETVHVVVVEGRADGTYLFRSRSDAERFLAAVHEAGGCAALDELPINHAPGTAELIAQELEA